MAEKLSKFDWTSQSKLTEGDKAVYPWDDWMDGDIWQLVYGEDFDPHPLMMERIIRTRATGRGAKVKLRHQALNGDPFGILILQRSDVIGPSELKRVETGAKRAAAKAAKQAEAEKFVKDHNLRPVDVAKTPKNGAAKNGVKAAPAKATKAPPSKVPSKSPAKVPSRRPVKKAALTVV